MTTFRDAPWRRLPPSADEGRLLGGLDLAATLASGRPVAAPGLLAEADGGVIVVAMAERLGRSAAAHLCAALDTGVVVTERDGLAGRAPARFAAVLLDEGRDDERAPEALVERLAFTLDLEKASAEPDLLPLEPDEIAGARARVTEVVVPDDILEALCATGLAFGVPSLRVATLAVRAAKAAAALDGRDAVTREDAELAAALVLAPRATRLPAARDDETQEEAEPPPPEPEAPEQPADAADTPPPDEATPGEAQPLADSVAEATRAAIPAELLAALAGAAAGAPRAASGGKSGAPRQAATRGRPAGTRRGAPGGGRRLALVDTLRGAAPWQPLRRRAAGSEPGRVLVRREDFRVARFKQRSEAVTIVCVDASGSAALNRLAEAKGAVELILADCYVRRDQVALIAFRGAGAAVVLPPTRSLARAKRALAGQAGGGGTPLAAGVEAAALLADAVRRRGQTPLVVMMTDGKANIGRDGQPGRAAADGDAQAAATAFRVAGTAALVLDIAPRPAEPARRLATAMGAAYIALPYADAGAMSRAVLAARPAS